MSVADYSNLLKLSTKSIGHFVHIYHDSFVHNVQNNVLGSYDDHNVGKVVKVEAECVHVQFGAENNIGIYDTNSLGLVEASLKPTAINKSGALGVPGLNYRGYIMEWSNFGKGDTVKIFNKTTTAASVYNKSDLEFHIVDSHVQGALKRGGQRTQTFRKKRLPAGYTRSLKRV
jgi:hypothetical protein